MKNETQKSYHLDPAKLTPEQRDKLENYKMVKEQNQSLADIADMMQELLDVADTGNKNTGQLKALGAILTDAREQLVEMNKKEAPEAPDYGKPIVEAIGKLEKAVQAQETKPQVNVASPNVQVDAPDLTEFNNILRKEMPKAFKEAIKLIPKTDVVIPEAPDRWDEVIDWLQSIDTASRMKPLPGTMKVTNPDGSVVGGGGVQYTQSDFEVAPTGTVMMFIRDDGTGEIVTPSDNNPLPIQIPNGLGGSGLLTDAELRATPVPVEVTSDTYSAIAVDASALGDNTIVAITNTARLYYVSLSANGANSADVTAIVSIGTTDMFKVSLKAGSIFARNIGAGRRYLTGSTGDDIIVNLSDAQTVHVSVEYEDI